MKNPNLSDYLFLLGFAFVGWAAYLSLHGSPAWALVGTLGGVCLLQGDEIEEPQRDADDGDA